MILLCYDGSPDAEAAIDHAARMMPGTAATVLTVWEPFLDVMLRNGAMGAAWGSVAAYPEDGKIDAASEQAALEQASEGSQRAAAAGLRAQPRTRSSHGGISDAILEVAAEVDADIVVLGTRGLNGVKSYLLGSVSHALLQHADRGVLVVPSGAVIEQRHHRGHPAEALAGLSG